jgi:tetratricopeptide (TPR) repeat protein
MLPDENQARFHHLIARSAQVARQQIEHEGESTPISDEARMRALNVLSYALNHADAWAATRDLLLVMATKMEIAGYRQEWLRYLEEGFRQSQQQGDRPAEAALGFHCGHLRRLMSQYIEADVRLRASMYLYAALSDKQGETRALNQLAYLAWQQHRYDEAEQLAHRALALDAPPLEKAVSLSALGLVANDRSRYAEAETYHRQAWAIRSQHAMYKEMAWSLQNLGLALREQGQSKTAIEHYQQAISLLDKVYDPAHKAIIQMNLGGAYLAQGNYSQALDVLDPAEKSLRTVSDAFNLAKLLTIRGLCCLALGQGERAEEAFQASADLFYQLNDRSWYLNAYDGLGISYLEQEKYDQALAIFEDIAAQLPAIEGTPAYKYLTAKIVIQIEQAQNKQVKRGESVYSPPQKSD